MNPYQNERLAPVIEMTRRRMVAAAREAGHVAVGPVGDFGANEDRLHPEINPSSSQPEASTSDHVGSSPSEARVSTGYSHPLGLKRVSIVLDSRHDRLRGSGESDGSLADPKSIGRHSSGRRSSRRRRAA